jgi:putative ABC transport system substrate-binding protein
MVSGAAVWSFMARAQQPNQMRRIGVLMALPETDPEAKALLAAFTNALSALGWVDGRNVRMDLRWAPAQIDLMRAFAKELVDLRPDVILSNSTPATAALKHETATVPIVFAVVADPVGSRFVADLSHPGGNITGFAVLEPSMAGKWLEMLREIAPGVKRVTLIFNPDTAPYLKSFFMPSFEATAQSFNLTATAAPVHNEAEIETAITSLAREPGGALLVAPDNFMDIHRASIVLQAARNKVPAIYQSPVSARDGGLIAYGADFREVFRRSASYVDSILRGAKPSELPVQLPIKYLMIINLRTAKALGLTIPPTLLSQADEVIE